MSGGTAGRPISASTSAAVVRIRSFRSPRAATSGSTAPFSPMIWSARAMVSWIWQSSFLSSAIRGSTAGAPICQSALKAETQTFSYSSFMARIKGETARGSPISPNASAASRRMAGSFWYPSALINPTVLRSLLSFFILGVPKKPGSAINNHRS